MAKSRLGASNLLIAGKELRKIISDRSCRLAANGSLRPRLGDQLYDKPTFGQVVRYQLSVSDSAIFRHLIVPKRLHGINQSGVASRDVAGEKRHGN